jgi:DNA-binding response OmpR family regulator
VLIVEDDQVTALVISEYLQAHGYRTSVARNGPEAMAMFHAEAPDLALVDVQLPRKDGFQVCYEMRATGLPTMIVLMSAHERNVEQAELFVGSFLGDGFLLKPFDLDVLVERVYALVGN